MTDVSILKISSAMARHASIQHEAISSNIAHADSPGSKAFRVAPFQAYMKSGGEGIAHTAEESNQPIDLDTEMMLLSKNAARHEASTLIWTKVLEMMRLSGAAPR